MRQEHPAWIGLLVSGIANLIWSLAYLVWTLISLFFGGLTAVFAALNAMDSGDAGMALMGLISVASPVICGWSAIWWFSTASFPICVFMSDEVGIARSGRPCS